MSGCSIFVSLCINLHDASTHYIVSHSTGVSILSRNHRGQMVVDRAASEVRSRARRQNGDHSPTRGAADS